MSSTLWKHDSYINKNVPFLFNKEIIEYDMKEAGFSLTQEFQLLDKKEIEKLKKYRKDNRKIELGKIQRNNETYKKGLKNAFETARQMFFEANDIEDSDIVSIKKDAIFASKTCKNHEFLEYIDFRPKHFYTSYIQLPNNIELYYSPNELSIKGIDDEKTGLHQNGMIHFINLFFKKMETEDTATVIEFTKRFIDKYKRRELGVEYYRTFDHKSKFYVSEDGTEFNDYWDDNKDELDITYNFYNVLLKLIQIPL